jgi:hypothetical protein
MADRRWRKVDVLIISYLTACILAVIAHEYAVRSRRSSVLADWRAGSGYAHAIVLEQRGIWYTRTGGDLLAIRRVPILPFLLMPVPAALCLPVAIVWGSVLASRAIRTRERRRHGLCIACGYDLRATAGRCPECGAERCATDNGRRLVTVIELLVFAGIGIILMSLLAPTWTAGPGHHSCYMKLAGIHTYLLTRPAAPWGNAPYPDTLDAKALAILGQPADALQCPLTSGMDHVYRGGLLSSNPPPTGVVFHDPVIGLHQPGTLFFFADGHVELLVDQEANNFIRQLDQGINPPNRVLPP